MFGVAVAVSVPVASNGPTIFKVEFAALIHVEPAAVPVIPPAAVEVMLPLFVIDIDPDIAIVPANVRFAVEAIDLAAESVNVPVLVTEPEPSIVAEAPERVTPPVPL